jgi:hypothetical protein
LRCVGVGSVGVGCEACRCGESSWCESRNEGRTSRGGLLAGAKSLVRWSTAEVRTPTGVPRVSREKFLVRRGLAGTRRPRGCGVLVRQCGLRGYGDRRSACASWGGESSAEGDSLGLRGCHRAGASRASSCGNCVAAGWPGGGARLPRLAAQLPAERAGWVVWDGSVMVLGRTGHAAAGPVPATAGRAAASVSDGAPGWSTSGGWAWSAAAGGAGGPAGRGSVPSIGARPGFGQDGLRGRIRAGPGYEVTGKAETRID